MGDDIKQKVLKDLKKITTSKIQKRNLILASLLLSAFETLKYVLVNRPNGFFRMMVDSRTKQYEVSDEFKKDLLEICKELPKSEHGNQFLVMSHWFKKHDGLDDPDIEILDEIRLYRNEVAHELLKFLIDSDYDVDIDFLFKIRKIVEKVDIWWIKEVELPINPDFDGIEVKDSDIQSGNLFILDHLLSIALEIDERVVKDKGPLVH